MKKQEIMIEKKKYSRPPQFMVANRWKWFVVDFRGQEIFYNLKPVREMTITGWSDWRTRNSKNSLSLAVGLEIDNVLDLPGNSANYWRPGLWKRLGVDYWEKVA